MRTEIVDVGVVLPRVTWGADTSDVRPEPAIKQCSSHRRDEVCHRIDSSVELAPRDPMNRLGVTVVVVGANQLPVVRMCSSGHRSLPRATLRVAERWVVLQFGCGFRVLLTIC